MPAPLVAVLDANVLFPFQLRNFLLHLAVEELFDPLWSQEIVDEFCRHLREEQGLSSEQLAHLTGQMREHFPQAWGEGYAGRADDLVLPDEGDRHVIALALHYEADFIITNNERHFPRDLLGPLGIEPSGPDAFVERLAGADLPAVFRAAEMHRLSLTRHPLAPEEYITSLHQRAALPRTAERLATAGFIQTPRPLPSERARE